MKKYTVIGVTKAQRNTICKIRDMINHGDLVDTSKEEYKEAAETLLEAYDDIRKTLEIIEDICIEGV